MNSVVFDAIELCKVIKDNLLEDDKGDVINIIKHDGKALLFSDYPSIPTSFCYLYDRTPQLLMKAKVFLNLLPNTWFERIVDEDYEYAHTEHELDSISYTMSKRGWLAPFEAIKYFQRVNNDEVYDIGPTASGQFSALVDVRKLREFIDFHDSTVPKLDLASGSFTFLEQTISFKGSKAKKTLELLLSKLNRIVPNEELHNINGGQNYAVAIQKLGKTNVHAAIKDRVDAIIDKFKTNHIVNNAVIIGRKNGYGLFINQNATDFPRT